MSDEPHPRSRRHGPDAVDDADARARRARRGARRAERSPVVYPVAEMTASGVNRVPSTSTTSPSSNRSTAATGETRPARSAATRPTSMVGVSPVERACATTPCAGGGHAVPREIPDDPALEQAIDRVDEPGGGVLHRDGGEGDRHRSELARDDVRRRADGQPHPAGTLLGEVRGDLGARVARADDEDVLADVRRGCPVLGGVDHLACDTTPDPASPAAAASPRSRVAKTTCARRDVAVVGGRGPRSDLAVEPAHRGAQPRLDAVVAGIPAQVLGHVVLGDPPPVLRGHPQAGQRRLHARRVQVQPVVASAPGVADGRRPGRRRSCRHPCVAGTPPPQDRPGRLRPRALCVHARTTSGVTLAVGGVRTP